MYFIGSHLVRGSVLTFGGNLVIYGEVLGQIFCDDSSGLYDPTYNVSNEDSS